jgi:hypothetical protein
MTEQGYYGYRFERFGDLLKHARDSERPDFYFSAPPVTDMTFDYDHNRRVHDYLYNRADNFLYIYGDDDTWTAAGVDMEGSPTNSVVIRKSGGDHLTRIMNLNDADRERVFSILADWLDYDIEVLRDNASALLSRRIP